MRRRLPHQYVPATSDQYVSATTEVGEPVSFLGDGLKGGVNVMLAPVCVRRLERVSVDSCCRLVRAICPVEAVVLVRASYCLLTLSGVVVHRAAPTVGEVGWWSAGRAL